MVRSLDLVESPEAIILEIVGKWKTRTYDHETHINNIKDEPRDQHKHVGDVD